MNIRSLTMRNFMPYRGEHVLTFPSEASRNVTVIFGDNMRGKTSLLNAFRWCLYGRALGRHLTALDLASLVNRDAASSGDWTMEVHLSFEWQGDDFDLRRIARPRQLIRRPRNAGDFDIDVVLQRNGTVLSADIADHTLGQIAPEQISRFFLFDGELLQEYEALLSDESRQGREIKAAIEQVLGVPALIEGRNQISTLRKKAQTEQAKEAQHTKSLRGLADEQLGLQQKQEEYRKDLDALKVKRAESQATLDELEDYLASTEAFQKVKVRLDILMAERATLEARDAEIRNDRLAVLRSAWKDLIQPRLQGHMETLRSSISKHHAMIERVGALKSEAERLRAALQNEVCEACGSRMDPARRESVGRELARVEHDLAQAEPDGARFQRIAEELNRLSRITATGARERLSELEDEATRNALRLTSIETEADALQEQVRGQDTAEIARRREQRDLLFKHLGSLERDIERVEGDIERTANRQRKISTLISSQPENRHRRSTRKVEVYEGLERVFDEAVGQLRDRLRSQVEAFASETFLRLTTEQSYARLAINSNYGLSIVDEQERVVTIRSAGAEQIVALSLIDGLNRTARQRGPIIMDTPLGRLDLKHRASVLAEVPRMADQVILLVHEGEISRETGLEPLKANIDRIYEIQRVSSSESRIRRVTDEVVA